MKKQAILIICFLLCFSGCGNSASQEQVLSPAPTLTPMPCPSQTSSPSLTPPLLGGDLQIDVVYRPVVIDGLTEVKAKEGEGIELDLDGDGIAEQMYVCGEGIFINGKRQLLDFDWPNVRNNQYFHPWETYWIVDVDNSDAYYNLIFELGEENPYTQEVLACYAGAIIELGRAELFFSDGFRGATYYGDGTFQMEKCRNFMGVYYPVEVECYLDGGKKLVEKLFSAGVQPIGEPWPFQLLESVIMYSEADHHSEAVIVEPQEVLLLASGSVWGLFRLEDGTEAWLYVEDITTWMVEKVRPAKEVFDGFPDVP